MVKSVLSAPVAFELDEILRPEVSRFSFLRYEAVARDPAENELVRGKISASCLARFLSKPRASCSRSALCPLSDPADTIKRSAIVPPAGREK